MNKIVFVIAILISFSIPACSMAWSSTPDSTTGASTPSISGQNKIQIVAVENFYGNLAEQLGGDRVSVTSILSNPNVDPHEYEANMQNAKSVYDARLVIENGDDYDTWMDKLLSASPNANRVVISAAAVAPHKLSDNPHVWYSLTNIQAVAQAITDALIKIDSRDADVFKTNLASFEQSLAPVQQKLEAIKAKYAGTPVGLTESIFLYQTESMGLKVLTPFDFQKAIAEGNDPPADTVVIADDQITQKQVKILIYNKQTITPITTNLQDEAKKAGIPVVPISETMPENKNYQQWMLEQLNILQESLGG